MIELKLNVSTWMSSWTLLIFSDGNCIMENQVIASNKKALHEYHILERFESGISLIGSEVKSLREGKANLKESYVSIRKGEIFLIGMHINPYSHTGFEGHDPVRDRKLLLHKKEILKLTHQLAEKGLTAVPLKMYFKGGRAKLEFALAKGKRNWDKKESIKEKDIKRDTERELKRYR